jgi:hypothetical protein
MKAEAVQEPIPRVVGDELPELPMDLPEELVEGA